MKAERLYEKVMLEAERIDDRKWKEQRLEIVRRNTRQPETKSQQCRKQLSQLRVNTAEIERELDLRKEVEVESQRNLEARMKLLEASRTPAEKKAYDAEIRRGQLLFSRVVEENSPDWRSQPNSNLEFYQRQMTTPSTFVKK
jgi:hypothetical protein